MSRSYNLSNAEEKNLPAANCNIFFCITWSNLTVNFINSIHKVKRLHNTSFNWRRTLIGHFTYDIKYLCFIISDLDLLGIYRSGVARLFDKKTIVAGSALQKALISIYSLSHDISSKTLNATYSSLLCLNSPFHYAMDLH